MRIAIIVEEQNVMVDGHMFHMPELDWSVFEGRLDTKWDDVHVVHYDSAIGRGHVEYRTIVTEEPDRPNVVPGNRPLHAGNFDQLYGWVVQAHARRKAVLDAEEASKKSSEDHRHEIAPEPVAPQQAYTPENALADPRIRYDEPAEPPAPGSWSSILANLNEQASHPAPEVEPDSPQIVDEGPSMFAQEVPATDDEIRSAAILAIKEAAANLTALSNRDQIKYELAMQAKNGSAYAQSLFVSEAKDKGISVDELASHVLSQRKDHEALIMRVSAVESRVLASIGSIAIDDLPYAVDAAIDELKKGAERGSVD